MVTDSDGKGKEAGYQLEPRLLRLEEAKRYLGGADPRHLLPAIRIGTRPRWDRKALDRALDELSGIRPPQGGLDEANPWDRVLAPPESAATLELAVWRSGRAKRDAARQRELRDAVDQAAHQLDDSSLSAAFAAGKRSIDAHHLGTVLGLTIVEIDDLTRFGMLERSQRGGAARYTEAAIRALLASKAEAGSKGRGGAKRP